MFNTTVAMSIKQHTDINIKPACMGMLQRSHPDSKFTRFHKNSEYARRFFEQNPHILLKDNWGKETRIHISILQIMVFGDNEFLAEYLEV